MSVKDDLMKEIEAKIAKRRLARDRALANNTVEVFALTFIANIEDINTNPMITTEAEWYYAANNAKATLMTQLRSIDHYVDVEVIWLDEESEKPVVNGVLIKWSEAYQKLHKVEPEYFVDVTQLLFNA